MPLSSFSELVRGMHVQDLLSDFRRIHLCHQPTALEEMPRLTAALGGPRLWIKRDDCTGLATGGNKTRKLEFLMAEAQDAGADMVVTQGAVQSNHVRQTAAAAAKLGMKCHAVLERRVPNVASGYETTGNVLFDQMFGATMEFRPSGLDMNAEAQAVMTFRAPPAILFIPGGGSNEIGALGIQCRKSCMDRGRSRPEMDCGCHRQCRHQAGLGRMPDAISRLWHQQGNRMMRLKMSPAGGQDGCCDRLPLPQSRACR